MPLYGLYIDDSGNRAYSADRTYGTTGISRYFVYGAFLITLDDASAFVPRIHDLKRLTFQRTDVEIKSNWLRIPKETTARYLDPFQIEQTALDGFVEDYYRLITGAPLQLFGSVVDKLHMQEKYELPWYPHTMAYEVLMQRIVQAVPVGSTVRVFMDNVSGKTSNQTEYQKMIQAHHAQLRKHGSRFVKSLSFSAVDGPVRFMNSATSDLVQVADVAAYNIFRQFRDHGENWESSSGPGARLPMYPYFSKIAGKFHVDGTGRVQGFGIVKCPLRKRVKWAVEKPKN